MAYHLDVKKLFNDLRGPKGVAALTEELVKVSNEVDKLRSKLQPQAEGRIKRARANIDDLHKLLKKAQGDLDRELNRTLTLVKKYGVEAEKKFKNLGGKVKKGPARKSGRKATAKGTRTKKAKSSKKA